MFQRLKVLKAGRSGFTLTEILAVVAIMGILATLTLGGLGANSSKLLASGGNRVVDLINQARQNAISQNVPTAFIMVTNSGNDNWDYHLFGIYQLSSPGPGLTSVWTQAAKWSLLPTGVIVDKNNNYSMPKPSLPIDFTLNYQGTAIPSSQTAYQVFLPTGALWNVSNPPYVSLVSGMINGNNPSYLGKTSGGIPINYYQITVNIYTGIPRVDRP